MASVEQTARLQRARQCFAEGRLDESESLFNELAAVPDLRAASLAGIGLIRLSRQDDNGAEQSLRASQENGPNADGLYGLGMLAQRRGLLGQAASRLLEASALGHLPARQEAARVASRIDELAAQAAMRPPPQAQPAPPWPQAPMPPAYPQFVHQSQPAPSWPQAQTAPPQPTFTPQPSARSPSAPSGPSKEDVELAAKPADLPDSRAALWRLYANDLLANTGTSSQSRECLHRFRDTARKMRPRRRYAFLSAITLAVIWGLIFLAITIAMRNPKAATAIPVVMLLVLIYRYISIRRHFYTVEGGMIIVRKGIFPSEKNYELRHLGDGTHVDRPPVLFLCGTGKLTLDLGGPGKDISLIAPMSGAELYAYKDSLKSLADALRAHQFSKGIVV